MMEGNGIEARISSGVVPAWAPPTGEPWQSNRQLNQHLQSILSNASLLTALANELEAIACIKGSPSYELSSKVSPDELDLGNQKCEFDMASRPMSLKSFLLESVGEDSSCSQNMESLAVEASTCLQKVLEAQIAPLVAVVKGTARWEDTAAVARLAGKQLKRCRNRKWKRKHRQHIAEKRRKELENFDKVNCEVDEWRTNEVNKELSRSKMEKMKEVAKRKVKEEQQRLEEELKLILIVEKLKELRSIRIEKLKRQGRFLPEEDDRFLERVRAAVEEEERQAAAAADTNATALAIASAAEEARKTIGLATSLRLDTKRSVTADQSEGKNEQLESEGEKDGFSADLKDNDIVSSEAANEKNEEVNTYRQDGVGGLPAEFYHYYHGSNADMGTLIEVRRMWDMYIMPGGSRIPGHWVSPPPPADDVWASCLVQSDIS